MSKNNLRVFSGLCILSFLMLLPAIATADTWRLDNGKEWQNVADAPSSEYMLAISNIKQLIADGKTKDAEQALVQFKKDFTEIDDAELDLFIEAEILYSKSKWVKAVKKYDEFLNTYPNSSLFDSVIEREFQVATAFLTGEKRVLIKILKLSAYEEGAKIMQRIADRTGDAPIAKRALLAIAKSYGARSKYLEAYEAWTEISVRWPTGDLGRDALLNMAQTLHSAYKGYNYDSATLVSAKSYYINFRLRYPELADKYDINENIELIDQQLAYKQYKTGTYYERADKFQAANLYYQMTVDQWPDSSAAKLANTKLITTTPQSIEKQKKFRRKVFDGTTAFLDSWFGLTKLKKSSL